MTDKPKRQWFQIHLSTAIMLMFVVSGLIGANVRSTTLPPEGLTSVGSTFYVGTDIFGWPLEAWSDDYVFAEPKQINRGVPSRHFDFVHLAINIAFALAILAAIAFVCEWLIRRREARSHE